MAFEKTFFIWVERKVWTSYLLHNFNSKCLQITYSLPYVIGGFLPLFEKDSIFHNCQNAYIYLTKFQLLNHNFDFYLFKNKSELKCLEYGLESPYGLHRPLGINLTFWTSSQNTWPYKYRGLWGRRFDLSSVLSFRF